MAANSTFYSDDVILLGVDQEFVGLHIAMWIGVCASLSIFCRNGGFGYRLHRWRTGSVGTFQTMLSRGCIE